MQTVEQTPADPLPTGEVEELQLLLNWSPDPAETIRLRVAAIGTVVVHLLLIGGLGAIAAAGSMAIG